MIKKVQQFKLHSDDFKNRNPSASQQVTKLSIGFTPLILLAMDSIEVLNHFLVGMYTMHRYTEQRFNHYNSLSDNQKGAKHERISR